MSTVPQHLAALQFMQAMRWSRDPDLRRYGQFTQEAGLFCEVHLRDLVAAHTPDEMTAARIDMERRLRDQHPAMADRLIAAWRADEAANPSPGQGGSKP